MRSGVRPSRELALVRGVGLEPVVETAARSRSPLRRDPQWPPNGSRIGGRSTWARAGPQCSIFAATSGGVGDAVILLGRRAGNRPPSADRAAHPSRAAALTLRGFAGAFFFPSALLGSFGGFFVTVLFRLGPWARTVVPCPRESGRAPTNDDVHRPSAVRPAAAAGG